MSTCWVDFKSHIYLTILVRSHDSSTRRNSSLLLIRSGKCILMYVRAAPSISPTQTQPLTPRKSATFIFILLTHVSPRTFKRGQACRLYNPNQTCAWWSSWRNRSWKIQCAESLSSDANLGEYEISYTEFVAKCNGNPQVKVAGRAIEWRKWDDCKSFEETTLSSASAQLEWGWASLRAGILRYNLKWWSSSS